MLVSLGRVELRIPAQSLKEKRRALRSIVDRSNAKLNVRLVEVEGQDAWQRAVLGFAIVGSDRVTLQRVTDRVFGFVQQSADGQVVAQDAKTIVFADLVQRGGDSFEFKYS